VSPTTGPPTTAPVGVLLANLGTPSAPSTADVRRYLRQFLSDRRVVDLPRWWWLPLLHLVILWTRPPRSAELYRSVWTDEGSPLLVLTRRLGDGLRSRLRGVGSVELEVGMRYGSPSIASALDRLSAAGCRRIAVLPAFPQYSSTTTAAVVDAVAAWTAGRRDLPELRVVRGYADHPAYVDALARSVEHVRRSDGGGRRLLMSFHGIPVRYERDGDPYRRECAATANALARRLGLAPGRWYVAFQSRFGREPWIGPATDAVLRRWAVSGVDGVDVVCPGFAVDCLETLEEIAATGRHDFEHAGGRGFRYVPALNDAPAHADALAAVLGPHLGGWLPTAAGRG
jgi:ferrochelatase